MRFPSISLTPKTLVIFAAFMFLLTLAVNTYTVMIGVYPIVTGGGLEDYGKYVKVYYVGQHLFPLKINSTAGEVTVPIEGKVNVFVPQYVRCPDVCHYETNIMRYAMLKLQEDGLLDRVVFVTVEVDPWKGTVEEARQYIEESTEPLGIEPNWIWVGSEGDIETLKKLWIQLGITVQRDPETGLIQHTAGFYIVSENGFYLYFVGPTPDGWKAQDKVAEALYLVIKAVVNGEEIDPGHPLSKLVIRGEP